MTAPYQTCASTKIQGQALLCAGELNQVPATGGTHGPAARLEMLFGDVPAVRAHTKVLNALVSDHGFKTYEGLTRFCKGWAVASSASVENGIAFEQQSVALFQAKNCLVSHHRAGFSVDKL